MVSRRQFLGALGGAAAGGVIAGGGAGGLVGAKVADGESGGGGGSGGRVADGRPIVIGALFPLTGSVAQDGRQMRNGATLAVEEINAAGGVAGRPLELRVLDTDVSAPEAVSASCRRLVDARVDAVVAGYLIGFKPAFDILPRYGAPFVHVSAQQAQVDVVAGDPERYRMVFQACPPETVYGENFVPFLDALAEGGGWRPSAQTIFVVEGDTPYSQHITSTVLEAIADSGWTVAGRERIISPINDWGAVLAKIRSAKPGVVMNTHFFSADLAAFARQFAANPTDALVYLQYGPSVPEFIELAGSAADGIVWSANVAVLPDALGRAFERRYEERFDEPAGFSNSASAYDEIHLLARAWGEVGDTRDFDRVCDALRAMIHRGVTGGYQMDGRGASVRSYPDETPDSSLGQAHLFFQVQEGRHVAIAPAPYVRGSFEPARWMGS
ncbi:ABC transporter substrate-binding protein [Conexibacter arvalis]|uniref:Branched-chain amino acid transport system substrate-binding protein n=1 Tax=Conexibacter arvalis TaxID=912552 RepID=A0A840IFN4_9ACTN|nr:ABC transporter substrate-binding protein [Conexibacter arvalis]MBB4663041.1 branched-chain amino acid transport system substrate-binding protein [Conexibacter arvalis]